MPSDLQSTINQSAADKLIRSVAYPFTVFERKTPYKGLAMLSFDADELDEAGAGMMTEFEDDQYKALLEEVAKTPVRYDEQGIVEATNLAQQTRQALIEIGQNARECKEAKQALDARPEPDKPAWDGPTEEELNEIIATAESSSPDLESLRALGDWGIAALVTWIRVQVREAPGLTLNSPTVGLSVKVGADGTGEVWLKHPWLKCVKRKWGICYGWKKIVKHTLLLRVTLRGIKVRANARAHFETDRALVKARGEFIELRLDHRYLDRIPLERVANLALADRKVTVFDAGKLVATVPVLGSRFTVDRLDLPQASGAVTVQVTVRQV